MHTMAKRKKSAASRLDEVDRTIYSSFCSAANSLSQIYSQAVNQQKIAFQAGERRGVEKVHNWVVKQLEEGLTPSMVDLLGFLKNEIDHGDDPLVNQLLVGGGVLAVPQGIAALSKVCTPFCSEAEVGALAGGGIASSFGDGDTPMDTLSDAHHHY